MSVSAPALYAVPKFASATYLERSYDPGAAAPCTSVPQSSLRHLRLGGESSQPWSASLLVTVIRGGGYLKVLIEATHRHMGTVSVRLVKKRSTHCRSIGFCRGRGTGSRNELGAPIVMVQSPEDHSECLSWNTAGRWRIGIGAGWDRIQDRAFPWRVKIHAGTLKWSFPGHLG